MADFVTPGDDPTDIANAVNFLLANTKFEAPPNLVANPDGTISNKDGTDIAFLYPNLSVKYADSPQGLNFSNVPTNRQYFGIRNTDATTESTNYLDYSWTLVTGGFSTNKFLYYATTGGRQVLFKVSTGELGYWERVPTNILSLDRITGTSEGLTLSAPNVPILPKITGGFDTTSTAMLVCTATFANGNTTSLSVVASTDAYGRLSVVVPAITNDFSVGLLGNGTSEVAVTFTNKIGSITGYFYSGTAMGLNDGSFEFPLQYLILRYATNSTGSDISVNPVGKTYIGLMNNISATTTENPANFTWYPLATMLSNVNTVYVKNNGNRAVSFTTGNVPPDTGVWTDVQTLNAVNPNLDLDSRTGFVILRGFEETGNYRTLPVTTATGALTYSLPEIYNGSPSINPQTITNIQLDLQGRIIGITLFDTLAVKVMLFVAPATAAAFAFPHVVGQMLLFRNGVLLRTTDYSEDVNGFTLAQYTAGDSLIAWRFTEQQNSTPVGPVTPFVNYTTTTVANQDSYTFGGFTAGSELLFLNGMFLRDDLYDYVGNNIVLTFFPAAGSQLRAVSFRLLNQNLVPFTQLLGETTAGSSTITFVKPTITTDYTMMSRNGVAQRNVSDFTTADTSPLGGTLTLTTAAIATGDRIELTNLSASGAAQQLQSRAIGQVMQDGSTLIKVGEEDPSERGHFDVFKPQPTIAQQFESLNTMIDELKKQVKALQRSP